MRDANLSSIEILIKKWTKKTWYDKVVFFCTRQLSYWLLKSEKINVCGNVENSFGCVTTHASLVPICKAKFGLMRTRTLIIYRSIFSKDSTAHLTAIHQYSESHRTVHRTCFKCSDTLSYYVATSFKMFCSDGQKYVF